MSFVYTLLAVSLFVGILYVKAWKTKNRLSAMTWEHLVRQLEEVPTSGITGIALDYLQPAKLHRAMRADEMLRLVGGASGLKRMRANAGILLQLAAMAEQWNLEESIAVAERMRREALMLRRAVGKINRSLFFDSRAAAVPVYLQEAASAYYLMRQRVLVLYKANHKGHYGRLAIALGNPMAACGPAI